MKFAKGAMLGMMAGTLIGVMNSDKISYILKDTKRQMRKMKKSWL